MTKFKVGDKVVFRKGMTAARAADLVGGCWDIVAEHGDIVARCHDGGCTLQNSGLYGRANFFVRASTKSCVEEQSAWAKKWSTLMYA